MLQKEVRLREEALKKFVDVEKLFQKEESERMKFEKHLRDDVDARYSYSTFVLYFYDRKPKISYVVSFQRDAVHGIE